MIPPEEKPQGSATKDTPFTFADFERAMLESAKLHDDQPAVQDQAASGKSEK